MKSFFGREFRGRAEEGGQKTAGFRSTTADGGPPTVDQNAVQPPLFAGLRHP
jgi:hypothetical protein